MTLGQLIKSYRLQANLSQPELSEKSNIEQSYLSKLENDKSIPSDETFKGIIAALNLTVGEFINKEAYSGNIAHFEQVPLIKAHFERQAQSQKLSHRNFIYLCAMLIALGIALFYSGYTATIFSEKLYIYKSLGAVKSNEPLNLFTTPTHLLVDRSATDYASKLKKLEFEITRRRITEYQELQEFKGNSFVQPTKEGRRQFDFINSKRVPRTVNGVLQFLGIVLVVLGSAGFIVERRLYR